MHKRNQTFDNSNIRTIEAHFTVRTLAFSSIMPKCVIAVVLALTCLNALRNHGCIQSTILDTIHEKFNRPSFVMSLKNLHSYNYVGSSIISRDHSRWELDPVSWTGRVSCLMLVALWCCMVASCVLCNQKLQCLNHRVEKRWKQSWQVRLWSGPNLQVRHLQRVAGCMSCKAIPPPWC